MRNRDVSQCLFPKTNGYSKLKNSWQSTVELRSTFYFGSISLVNHIFPTKENRVLLHFPKYLEQERKEGNAGWGACSCPSVCLYFMPCVHSQEYFKCQKYNWTWNMIEILIQLNNLWDINHNYIYFETMSISNVSL